MWTFLWGAILQAEFNIFLYYFQVFSASVLGCLSYFVKKKFPAHGKLRN